MKNENSLLKQCEYATFQRLQENLMKKNKTKPLNGSVNN